MLITGGTKGLGLAIRERFLNSYEVITVGRNQSADLQGDLASQNFIEQIFNSHPDVSVVINNAALLTQNFAISLDVNLRAMALISLKYYSTMTSGHIINIGSNAAHIEGIAYEHMGIASTYYSMTKKCVKDFTLTLADTHRNPGVKVTLLEPEFINAGMELPEDIENSVELLDKNYLAGVIEWVLAQPNEVEVTHLRLRNKRY